MPKYIVIGSYNQAGVRGLLKDGGTGRRTAVTKMIDGLGGTLEAMYYAFGDDDVYAIVDAPDNVTVAAVSLAVGAAGAVDIRTVALLTAEEMDEAANKTVDYRPPGA